MRNRQRDIEIIFWSKMIRGESYICWPWIGAAPDEYGAFWDGNRLIGAHRYAWEITRKCKVPNGLMVLHMCDYRPCCNPNHLYVGNALQNAKDRVERSPKRVIVPGSHRYSIEKGLIEMYRFPYNYIADERKQDERDNTYERILSESYKQISEQFKLPNSRRSSLFDLL